MPVPMKEQEIHYVRALLDDEKNKHPFYSDGGVTQHKKRMKELEREEEEISKANARKARGKKTDSDVEENLSGSGGEQVRVVPSEQRGVKTKEIVSERTSHNREEVQTSEDRPIQRDSTVPKMPQVRYRHSRSRKPHKGYKLARSK